MTEQFGAAQLFGAAIARTGARGVMFYLPRVLCISRNQARQPLFKSMLLDEFLRLRDQENFTVTGAARAIGVPASMISGKASLLSRYLREGLAGLERDRSGGASGFNLSRRIEALGWFIPTARFFYLAANRKRGALPKAVLQAAALPDLPQGWPQGTRSRFLEHLDLLACPECPADLRQELAKRQEGGKGAVPPRTARLIKTSPASMFSSEDLPQLL